MATEAETQTDTTTAAPPSNAPSPVDPSEIVRERFAAVAARAGLETDYEDVLHGQALAWCKAQSVEPTREQLARFVAEQKTQRPKLFAATAGAPSNTAPPPHGPRSTPTPTTAGVETPYARWRALKDAGRSEDARAYYLTNARAINRSM